MYKYKLFFNTPMLFYSGIIRKALSVGIDEVLETLYDFDAVCAVIYKNGKEIAILNNRKMLAEGVR